MTRASRVTRRVNSCSVETETPLHCRSRMCIAMRKDIISTMVWLLLLKQKENMSSSYVCCVLHARELACSCVGAHICACSHNVLTSDDVDVHASIVNVESTHIGFRHYMSQYAMDGRVYFLRCSLNAIQATTTITTMGRR